MKKFFSFTLIIAALFSLCACGTQNPKAKSRSFFEYFDTVGTFYDYSGLSNDDFNSLADRVEEELSEYHKLYDIYNEYDGLINLATINKSAGKGALNVDKRIINMLLFAKEMYAFTEGKVNVAMGAVLKIWHGYRKLGLEVPDMALLEEANTHTSINDLVIDEEACTVELLDPEMSLDVGAIAKGYAVEMICARLSDEGYTGLVLDVGGNLRAIGTKPNGDGWNTGIKNPILSDGNSYVHRFELKNGATVTSGSYERYYTVNGVRYHHIINDETLMPENYYLSVSIISASSALADALSTAIFNMEYDKAKAFVESKKGLTVVFVFPDGEVEVVGG